MQRIICGLIVLFVPLLALAGDDAAKELKALQGTWKAVACDAGGKPFPKDAVPEFTFFLGADGKAKIAFDSSCVTLTASLRSTWTSVEPGLAADIGWRY